MDKQVTISVANNGFIVTFDTPAKNSPVSVEKISGGKLPPIMVGVMEDVIGGLAERAGYHDHEQLVFTDIEKMVDWLRKYYGKE